MVKINPYGSRFNHVRRCNIATDVIIIIILSTTDAAAVDMGIMIDVCHAVVCARCGLSTKRQYRTSGSRLCEPLAYAFNFSPFHLHKYLSHLHFSIASVFAGERKMPAFTLRKKNNRDFNLAGSVIAIYTSKTF